MPFLHRSPQLGVDFCAISRIIESGSILSPDCSEVCPVVVDKEWKVADGVVYADRLGLFFNWRELFPEDGIRTRRQDRYNKDKADSCILGSF